MNPTIGDHKKGGGASASPGMPREGILASPLIGREIPQPRNRKGKDQQSEEIRVGRRCAASGHNGAHCRPAGEPLEETIQEQNKNPGT